MCRPYQHTNRPKPPAGSRTEPAIGDFDGRNVSRTDVPFLSGAAGPTARTDTVRYFLISGSAAAGHPAIAAAQAKAKPPG